MFSSLSPWGPVQPWGWAPQSRAVRWGGAWSRSSPHTPQDELGQCALGSALSLLAAPCLPSPGPSVSALAPSVWSNTQKSPAN